MTSQTRSREMLQDKVAIITGSGTGIGKAIATAFAREGAKVIVVDFSGQQNAVAEALGPNAVPFQADISKEEDIQALFAHTVEVFGRVDSLVNNAGTIGGLQPEITAQDIDRMLAVNLRGLMLCCQHGMKAMQKNGGGSIVNVSSVSGFNAEKRTSIPYAAAKAGVHSLTKSLAVHYAPLGIRVNALAPGFVKTERKQDLPQQYQEEVQRKVPLGRMGRPEEQAEVAVFLASELSSYVTGAIIPVDGGWSSQLV